MREWFPDVESETTARARAFIIAKHAAGAPPHPRRGDVTHDGVAVKEIRAELSSRYAAYDSADVLSTIEPYVAGFELARPGVDRDEMAVTLVLPRDIPVRSRTVGDVVRVGLCVRNNEVGEGSLGVDFAVWRLKCLNGLVAMSPEVRVIQRHVGLDRRAFTSFTSPSVEPAMRARVLRLNQPRPTS